MTGTVQIPQFGVQDEKKIPTKIVYCGTYRKKTKKFQGHKTEYFGISR